MIKKKILKAFLFVSIVFLAIITVRLYLRTKREIKLSPYPYGKNFAFTVTDDPDWNTLEEIKPVYDLLDGLGFKTTIAVWVKEPTDIEGLEDPEEGFERGDTTQRREYLKYILELQKKGFEIALHTVSAGHDKREDTIQGYEEFKRLFGHYPAINIMHSKNKENIYWGRNAFGNVPMKRISDLYTKIKFGGENPSSPYFWGDVCKEKTKYVRMWGTSDINTLKFNPSMPYHNPEKPYVNYWFSFSDAYRGDYFKKLLSDKKIDKLVRERGTCIAYTHFACGFQKKLPNGTYVINDGVKQKLVKLSQQKEGWFVPASEILDRFLAMKNVVLNDLGKTVVISNVNDFPIVGITLLTKPGEILYDSSDYALVANSEGEIVIGDLTPNQATVLFRKQGIKYVKIPVPSKIEALMLRLKRLMIMVFSHRG